MRGRRGIISLGIATIMALSALSFIATMSVDASPGTLYVGGSGAGNYSSIQSAISDANPGDTVYVYSGIYYENVVVNKRINLIGEDMNATIIDASGSGHTALLTADSISLSHFTLTGAQGGDPSYYGLKIESDNNYISYCNISDNFGRGANAIYTSYNTFENCKISNNPWMALGLGYDNHYTTIINCNISNNGGVGIKIAQGSSHLTVLNSTLSNNQIGIRIQDTSYSIVKNCIISNSIENGIDIDYYSGSGHDNIIENNTIKNSHNYGIWLERNDNNIVRNNTIESNDNYGVYVDGNSDDNNIYHNNFIDNNGGGVQGYDAGTDNQWDNGYPSGGNYWGDYTGADNYHGTNQNIPGSDSIGDAPYSIPGGSNQDRYPLMSLWNVTINQKPIVTIVSPSDGSTISGVVSIQGTAGDTDGTVEKVEVRIDSGSWHIVSGTTGWNYNWNTLGVCDCWHTISARSYDGELYSEAKSVAVFVDNTPPDTTITSGPMGTINYNDVTFTWTGTDDTTPTNQLVYSYTLEYYSGYQTWTINTSKNYNDLPDESYTFKIKAKDQAGNIDLTPAQKSFTIDTTPPTTNYLLEPSSPDGDNGWYKTDVSVTLYASDNLSGVNSINYKIDDGNWMGYTGFFTLSSDGEHTISYYSVDNVGNEEEPKSVTFKIDKISPITSHELNPTSPDGDNGWYKTDVSITLTANDETSGVDYTKYRINSGSFQDYTDTLSISSEGIHILEYYSVDTVGNQETIKTVTIKIDKTIPETTHTLSPANPDGNNGWYKVDVSIKLAANDASSGVGETWYKINDGDWKKDTGGFIWIRDDGMFTVAYYSKDNAGNEENKNTIEIKKDDTPPSAVIKKPEEKYLYLFDRQLIPLFRKTIVIGRITVEVDADDITSGVDYVEFYIDDELQYNDTQMPYRWIYDEISILRHRHTIKTRVSDNAGNMASDEQEVWILNL